MTTKTFTDLGILSEFVDELTDQGIVEAFPIQELAIPMALKGADVIGQARTGTGKTLAFGLPLLQRIDPERDRTQALVITPTRELCLQVADDLQIGGVIGAGVQTVYGGVGYDEQIAALTSGVNVVVGTPGRLLDHLGRGNLDLSGLTELVLDEADEMLDMGFLPDVEQLIEASAEDRHTMLFSATMPSEIVKLARRYMAHPTFLRADVEEHEVSPTVDQHFFLVHRMDKPRILARILQTPHRGGVYCFTRTKRMADRLVRELDDLGVSAIPVHGDKRQATRERNMNRFRDGEADVLVATEVAARGLDVDNVTHVVNYDCPDDEKMYLHRIGRTARAGAEGVAITFAEFNEVDRLNVIRRAVEADDEVREIFSTSDALTETFDLPARTPWDRFGDDEQDGDGGRARSDGRTKNRTDGGGQSASGGRARRGRRARRTRTGRGDGAGPYVSPNDLEPTAVRTRSRNGAAADGDADADATDASAPQPGDNGRPARARRTRRRSRDGSSSSPRAEARARAGRDADGDDRRDGDADATPDVERETLERGRAEPIVRTEPGRPARGRGIPRLSRRLHVEHLP